jgi:hypothetical protein
MSKTTLFGKTTLGISDVANAVASNPNVGQSALSKEELVIVDLASEFGVPMPIMDLASLSTHARADVFDSVKSALRKTLMQSEKGRDILGNSILEPLRDSQLYRASLRRAFKEYKLGAGQENHIPVGLDVRAYSVSVDGDTIQTSPYGLEGVEAPLQPIKAEVLFELSHILRGKYDLLTYATDRAESGVFQEEDRRIAKLWNAVATSGDSLPVISVTSTAFKKTGLYTLIQAISEVEGQEGKVLNPVDIWLNPYWKQVFRTMSNYENGFQLSFNSADELMRKGIIAQFQGLRVNTSAMLPRNAVYITAEPETFGGFVESIPLMVIDTSVGTQVGFTIMEEVGMVVSNPKGMATIVISD